MSFSLVMTLISVLAKLVLFPYQYPVDILNNKTAHYEISRYEAHYAGVFRSHSWLKKYRNCRLHLQSSRLSFTVESVGWRMNWLRRRASLLSSTPCCPSSLTMKRYGRSCSMFYLLLHPLFSPANNY